MSFSIDYVFPYVNPEDSEWKKQYEYCFGEPCIVNERFRDFSFLRYIFRGIENFAPYIRNVFLLVHSKNQVPNWVNVQYPKLKIVEHKEFIPSTYLPTFNSNTIEMFIHNIEGLSEQFIYGNDDMIFMNPSTPQDFFNEGKVRIAYSFRYKKSPIGFLNTCKRSWELIEIKYGLNGLKMPANENGEQPTFLKQFHGSASPRLLSAYKKCYEELEPFILKSLTMTRNVYKNYNQYLFANYLIVNGLCNKISSNFIGTYYSKDDNNLNRISSCDSKMACINDTSKMTTKDYELVVKLLNQRFPNKSKFEL